MPGKLFVGNVPFTVSDVDLSELCASLNIETESVKIMRDMDTGKSRGFGFIELSADADMALAIKDLNGKALEGRPLVVNEARPPSPGRRSFGGGRMGPHPGGGRSDGPYGGGRNSRRKERSRPRRKAQELY
ncbi:MAG: RNA-binding protein [Acidobacteria bacterium]|nr:RNA-binding protein [Acidobacteriota bacterium]